MSDVAQAMKQMVKIIGVILRSQKGGCGLEVSSVITVAVSCSISFIEDGLPELDRRAVKLLISELLSGMLTRNY